MFLARAAYFKVFKVSSIYELAGEMLAIIIVLLFPPRESLSMRVSFESRQGTKVPFFELSPKALMQFASESSDRLIFAPSLNRIPRFSVTVPLSDPAKSISDIFPSSVVIFVFFVLGFESTVSQNTACDLEDVLLTFVDSVLLRRLPVYRWLMILS